MLTRVVSWLHPELDPEGGHSGTSRFIGFSILDSYSPEQTTAFFSIAVLRAEQVTPIFDFCMI